MLTISCLGVSRVNPNSPSFEREFAWLRVATFLHSFLIRDFGGLSLLAGSNLGAGGCKIPFEKRNGFATLLGSAQAKLTTGLDIPVVRLSTTLVLLGLCHALEKNEASLGGERFRKKGALRPRERVHRFFNNSLCSLAERFNGCENSENGINARKIFGLSHKRQRCSMY